MRGVDAIDATAMHNFESMYEECRKNHVQLIFSHVNEQPMNALVKCGLYDQIGAENFCDHIDLALARAEKLS